MTALESASPERVGDAPLVRELMLAKQTQMLYANLPLSLVVTLANGALLAALQATVVDTRNAIFWLAGLAAVTAVRFVLWLRFRRASDAASRDATADTQPWLARYELTAVASGAVWGSAAWFLYPADSVVYQVFLAFVLGGMVAGAVSLLTPVFRVFALFSLFVLVPAIARLLGSGDYLHYAMSGMATLFLLAMLATGRRVHETITQSMRLGLENRELVVDLTRARQHLQESNADLMRTQATLRATNEELEQRVAERTAALETADRRKDEFIAMLSHELRNPLAGICTSSYLLRRVDATSEYAVQARAMIERQAGYLSRLVDDLLDVTRIAHGKTTMRRERVDLAECVRRTVDDHRELFVKLRVHLFVQLPDDPVWAHVDPTRLAQLVGNLLQNAAKFTPASGQVTISLEAHDEWAVLRVSDTGVGIAPDLLPALFEPFVQGDRNAARTEPGLGLGLAMVRGIAELHGGTVRAESQGPGTGATFVVRVPRSVEDAEGKPRTDAPAAVAPKSANRSVLVVDDNRDAADSLVLLVEAFGHSADVAYDGPTAIEKAHERRPDIVLCDLGLPVMSGYDVARAIHAERREIRIIAVTGYTRPQDIADVAAAGFDGYVAKPPHPERIRELLS